MQREAKLLDIACCVRETGQTLSYVQTDATTPNIVGPTMLGVVGPTMLRLLHGALDRKIQNGRQRKKFMRIDKY